MIFWKMTLKNTQADYFKQIQTNLDWNIGYSQFVLICSSIEAAEVFVHQFPGAMLYGGTDNGKSTHPRNTFKERFRKRN